MFRTDETEQLRVTTETLRYNASSSERQMLVFDYVDRWKFSSNDLFSDDLMKSAL